jgi:hypothetical protein
VRLERIAKLSSIADNGSDTETPEVIVVAFFMRDDSGQAPPVLESCRTDMPTVVMLMRYLSQKK